MIYLLAPVAPLIVFAGILASIAHVEGGSLGVRLVTLPYVGPALMVVWAMLCRHRSRYGIGELRDVPQVVLAMLGLVGVVLFALAVVRHRRLAWRGVVWLNALPVTLTTAVVWFWGYFLDVAWAINPSAIDRPWRRRVADRCHLGVADVQALSEVPPSNQPMHQAGAVVLEGSVDLCGPHYQDTVRLRTAPRRVARR